MSYLRDTSDGGGERKPPRTDGGADRALRAT